MPPSEVFRFGKFTLNTSQNTLSRGSERLALRPQSFAVLTYLVRHSGETIANPDLIATFGDPRNIGDNSLAQCITDIRKALGDSAQQIVRTVPRRGYVLAAPVTKAHLVEGYDVRKEAARGAAITHTHTPQIHGSLRRPAYAARAALVILALVVGFGWTSWWSLREGASAILTMAASPSVVVMPFVAAQDEVSQKQAQVLAEAIATELGRGPHGFSLTVKSAMPTNWGSPKVIARELDVRYLVRGFMTGPRSHPHLNVQLIEGPTERQVLAQPFDVNATNALEQTRTITDIARRIAVQIRGSEAKRPLPSQPQAGHFTLLGRDLLEGERGAEATAKAQDFYRKALALNADFIPALQGFARTHVDLVSNVWIPRDQHKAAMAEASRAVEHLIEIAPRNVGAHLLRGVILRIQGEPELAIASFERALSFNPNYTFAHAEIGLTKIDLGRAEEAFDHIETALRLSPADPFVWAWHAWAGRAALHSGDYKAAIDWLHKARQGNRYFSTNLCFIAVAYAGLGEMAKAKSLMADFLASTPAFTIADWQNAGPPFNATVAAQRARIVQLMRQIGVPEGS